MKFNSKVSKVGLRAGYVVSPRFGSTKLIAVTRFAVFGTIYFICRPKNLSTRAVRQSGYFSRRPGLDMKLASQIATSIRGSLAFISRAVDLGKIFRKLCIAWQCCGLFKLNENFEYFSV